ncbi:MAG: tetratricopeptide repeat protein [Oscillospiraceae bacterium]|jgi:hypothetical protein|nr:tetratricopeptide repeat protein [Oscillospiraceae bacterium]
MSKQKASFRSVPAAEITKRYRSVRALFWALRLTVLIAAIVVVIFAILGKVSPFNAFFSAVTATALNWLLSVIGKIKCSVFDSVLTTDCDPVKLEQVFTPLDTQPDTFNGVTFNMVRALFYQGRNDEALERLTKAKKPKENSLLYFQYYNMLAHCYDRAGDLEKLLAIQQKIQNSAAKLKPNARYAPSARQLLAILNVMVAQQQHEFTRCRDACREMYGEASYALSRINISLRLAKIEQQTGANHSAVTRCEYIIDDGGTTFYVNEAKALYTLCCGKEYVPEDERRSLPVSLEELEDLEDEWDEDEDEYEDDIQDEEE